MYDFDSSSPYDINILRIWLQYRKIIHKRFIYFSNIDSFRIFSIKIWLKKKEKRKRKDTYCINQDLKNLTFKLFNSITHLCEELKDWCEIDTQ